MRYLGGETRSWMRMSTDETQTPSLAFKPHNHSECQRSALEAAEALCAERKARLTPVRRRVLEILWESHRPIGAYEILERLKEEGLGSQPPVIYRALDFLIAQGFAHKIPRQNAYLGCAHPDEPHPQHFLICTECDGVSELIDARLDAAVAEAAAGKGFKPKRALIEIEGLCAACAEAGN